MRPSTRQGNCLIKRVLRVPGRIERLRSSIDRLREEFSAKQFLDFGDHIFLGACYEVFQNNGSCRLNSTTFLVMGRICFTNCGD
jgi:hypothetical protein